MKSIRKSSLSISNQVLPLPLFFPSISSVKTILRPLDYLKVLKSFVGLNNQFLISAYDLAAPQNVVETIQIMTAMQKAGCIILMDSGNYESYWKEKQLNWRQSDFQRILNAYPCDLAFCFDEQHPPSTINEHIDLVTSKWRKDQEIASENTIIPIIHGSADNLPTLCAAIAMSTRTSILAVPERNLGEGIINRAHTIDKIRRKLDKLDYYVILHLLGTGNPISIAIYSSMGADSFDGLEWCQTVVDHETALLYHFSQAEFFAEQTTWGLTDLSFQARTLAHNLEFYTDWMQRLHKALLDNDIIKFCGLNFPAQIFEKCAIAFKWN